MLLAHGCQSYATSEPRGASPRRPCNPVRANPTRQSPSRCTTACSPHSTSLLGLTLRARADDELREWAGLAVLDAVELGEQLGMLHDDAEQRREVVRTAIEDLDRPERSACWRSGGDLVAFGRTMTSEQGGPSSLRRVCYHLTHVP